MNIFNPTLSLLEIEQTLEHEFLDGRKDLRIIGDMELSSDDYKYLSLKIKGLKRFTSNVSVYQRCKLSLVTSWVFAIKNEEETLGSIECLGTLFKDLPQYHIRYFTQLCVTTFDEYGISTFGFDTRTIDGIFSILLTHAGIPENLHDRVYDILDESLQIGQLHLVDAKIKNAFPKLMNSAIEYIEETNLHKIFITCRDLLIDCKIHELGKEELLKKYNCLPFKLILNCMKWCEDYEYIRREQNKKMI